VLNRRHIRVKVMQSIYAMHQNNSDNLEKEEKFLFYSIENIQDLYLTMLSSLMEIRTKEEDFLDKSSKKHLVTAAERNPNKKFINNAVLHLLAESNSISIAIENRNVSNVWHLHEEYILILLNEIKNSELYKKYMQNDVNTFEEDKQFIADVFTDLIAPNEKLYEFLEDNKLTWIDDIPLVNTHISKQLRDLKSTDENFIIPRVYKDSDDKDFVKDLFRKTVLNEPELAKEFIDKTPNWDSDRIAEIDTIILKMAICEFLKFPSIPVKVTINEYLEIAKEYSTPKSSIFINGILDNLIKDYTATNKLNKAGRGLM